MIPKRIVSVIEKAVEWYVAHIKNDAAIIELGNETLRLVGELTIADWQACLEKTEDS